MEKIYTERCLYKDTYTIISMMDNNLRCKINPKFIKFLEENQDNTYHSYINPKKPLKEQEIRDDIKLMLSIIYINYLCDSEKREMILKEEKQNIEKYNKSLYDNMFKKKQINNSETENCDNQLIVIQKESVIHKIINKIKKLLKMN